MATYEVTQYTFGRTGVFYTVEEAESRAAATNAVVAEINARLENLRKEYNCDFSEMNDVTAKDLSIRELVRHPETDKWVPFDWREKEVAKLESQIQVKKTKKKEVIAQLECEIQKIEDEKKEVSKNDL